jgi:hypothetical protein
MVDYLCMYDVYKLLYRRPIFNLFTNIIQLIDFFDMIIYLSIHHISRGINA